MLGSLTLILVCQLLGEIITKATKIPVPGPVIGMVILFCILLAFKEKVASEIESTGGFLLRYLALLFVPAGVGVITHLDVLMRSWAPIAGVVLIGTFITIGVTGIAMQLVNRHCGKGPKESDG